MNIYIFYLFIHYHHRRERESIAEHRIVSIFFCQTRNHFCQSLHFGLVFPKSLFKHTFTVFLFTFCCVCVLAVGPLVPLLRAISYIHYHHRNSHCVRRSLYFFSLLFRRFVVLTVPSSIRARPNHYTYTSYDAIPFSLFLLHYARYYARDEASCSHPDIYSYTLIHVDHVYYEVCIEKHSLWSFVFGFGMSKKKVKKLSIHTHTHLWAPNVNVQKTQQKRKKCYYEYKFK